MVPAAPPLKTTAARAKWLALALAASLLGCGQTGPLYLPEDTAPDTQTDSAGQAAPNQPSNQQQPQAAQSSEQ